MINSLTEIKLFVRTDRIDSDNNIHSDSDGQWLRLPVGWVKIPDDNPARKIIGEFHSTGKLAKGYKISYVYDTDPKGQ